jgi:integrase
MRHDPKALTELGVTRLRQPKAGRDEYPDSVVKGLELRISFTGNRTWSLLFRDKQGKLARCTIGAPPEIGVAEARRRAAEIKERRVNPATERKAAAEAAKAEATGTFAAVADRFVAEFLAQKRANTIGNWTRIIEKDVKPLWGDRQFRDITPDDALALFNAKAKTRPKQADEVRKVLRRLCSWAVEQRIIAADADPTKDVAKRVPKRADRDRVLDDGELRVFWEACGRLGWPFGPAFKLLALTAQRREEVGAAQRREFKDETWTVPAARSKNGKANIVHLSGQALAVLDTVPKAGDLLFASRGTTPSGYSKAKARLDGYMAEIAGSPVEPFVLHDLRRTATTGMARLGIAPHVADRVLNHVGGTISGVAKIYNQFAYIEEREMALDAWGLFVELVCEQELPGNVAVARVKRWMREEIERREEAVRGGVVPLRVRA